MQTEVDHGAIKTGQLLTVIWLIAAYITGRWELVAALTAVFALTSISARIGPLVLLYRFVLLPLRLARQDLRVDNPQPHQFGQAIGAVVAAIATYLLYSGQTNIGWGLVWLLIVLTAISFVGWCAGCFTYYLLNRLGVKGFFKQAPTDTEVFMGNRPKVRAQPPSAE